VLQIALDVMREPMFLLLITAGAIYLALGDLQEALLLGGSIVFIIAITFYQQRKTERALETLRALAFTTLVVANLSLIHLIRAGARSTLPAGRRPTRPLVWVTAGALLFLAATLYVPALQSLFRFSPLGPGELGAAVLAGIASVLWILPLRAIMLRTHSGRSRSS
jgi:magnesium-transporting ATPase (P-type)